MVYFLHMQIKLTQNQVQKQVFSHSMQQSIEILFLPITELSTTIEQELQNNPLLEINEDVVVDQDPALSFKEEENFNKLIRDVLDPINSYQGDETNFEISVPDERPIRKDETLEDHLLRQLHVDFRDTTDVAIGELIIGNLNEDGYLTMSLEEIARKLGLNDISQIERVLQKVQKYDPPGIAARDLKECLIVQLDRGDAPTHKFVRQIILQCLPELGQKKFAQIGRTLKIPLEDVRAAALDISRLEPRPARNYRPAHANIYIKPDVCVSMNEKGEYDVHLTVDGIPPLRVNSIYRRMLKQKEINKETKAFIREKLQNAVIFIRNIEQRGQTVKNIAQYIVEKQKDFFTQGHRALVPMNLKDIALALDRNESTISRAVSNKYMDTPQGTYPFKFFFSQPVKQGPDLANPVNNGDHDVGISNRRIKETIKDLITHENKLKPLSDSDIQKHFAGNGMKVARRTIAKYRQMERILPSHLRKQ